MFQSAIHRILRVVTMLISLWPQLPISVSATSVLPVFSPSTTMTHVPSTLSTPPDVRKYAEEEEYLEFLERCPSYRKEIQAACDRPLYSCKGRCGYTKLGDEMPCQCDVYCTMFEDCCWDFQYQCSAVHAMFYRDYPRLVGAKVSCNQANEAIIESCGSQTESEAIETTHDLREPYRSTSAGIIVSNMNAYRKCFQLESNATPWDHLIFLEKGVSTEILQQFFFSGTVAEGAIRVTQINTRNNDEGRQCPYHYRIICYRSPNKDICSDTYYNVIGSAALCRVKTLDGSKYSKTLKNGKVTPDGQKCYIKRYENTRNRLSIDTNQHHLVIRAHFGNGVNKPEFDYSIGEYEDLNLNLKRYKCQSQTASVPCRVQAVCKPGFIPIQLICRKPTAFAIQILGINESIVKLERNLLTMLQTYSLFYDIHLDEGKVAEQTNSMHFYDYKAVTYFSPFKQTEGLVYTETSLPMSNAIIQRLQEFMNTTSVQSHIRVMTVCFVIKKELYHSSLLLCDRLLFNADSITLGGHFSIPGTRMPNPFSEISLTNEVNTAAGVQLQHSALAISITILYFS